MTPYSLFASGKHTRGWIKDFYDQAGEWWGPDPQEPGVHEARRGTLERLCGAGPLRVLELGAGSGCSAAAMADAGHSVVAVELSTTRAALACDLAKLPRRGNLVVVEGDFYTAALPGPFDAVVCWETFGLGSDTEQRGLLRRIAAEWLIPGGRALVDVYNPARPAREAGREWRLPPLPGVPGSVEMFERCHFDARHCRWIDEWVPVAAPEQALAQSIRCYSPADLALLLEGTGLAIDRLEAAGQTLAADDGEAITLSAPLVEAWSYLAVLAHAADRV
jgi:SAM-dependent methyltransferase